MKYIVFDTSWLEGIQFDFSFAAFRCIQYTDYQVLIPHIVDEEIKKHILKRIDEFVSAYNDSFKKVRFLSNTTKMPKPLQVDKYKKAALNSYNTFKDTLRAQIIPSNLCEIDEVLHDYFSENGAFSKKGKKSEFPDAIAINSIMKHVSEGEIVVFTQDDDWKNAFAVNLKASVYDKKSDLLKIIKTDDLAGEVIDLYLDEITDELSQHLRNNFEKYFSNIQVIYPEDYCLEDLEIEDFDIELIEYNAIDIISMDKTKKTISTAVHFKYSFSMDISFDDNSCCSYDKEDNMKYNVLRRKQTLSGEETGYCFIDFEFGDDTFGKIISHEFSDIDFCFKDAHNYKIIEDDVEEGDYYDTTY